MESEKIEKTIFNWREFQQIVCPKCDSSNVAKILYGFPAWSDELEEKLGSGVIALGGCIVSSDNPVFKCNECKHSWGCYYDENKELFESLTKNREETKCPHNTNEE